eukprot:6281351-Alexandrium_andersonii.AAC.1
MLRGARFCPTQFVVLAVLMVTCHGCGQTESRRGRPLHADVGSLGQGYLPHQSQIPLSSVRTRRAPSRAQELFVTCWQKSCPPSSRQSSQESQAVSLSPCQSDCCSSGSWHFATG